MYLSGMYIIIHVYIVPRVNLLSIKSQYKCLVIYRTILMNLPLLKLFRNKLLYKYNKY